jgi:hypothetical protein
MSSMPATSQVVNKKSTPFAYFLGFVFVLFIAILIVCYIITKRSNPILLDQHGKPVAAAPAQASFEKGNWIRA